MGRIMFWFTMMWNHVDQVLQDSFCGVGISGRTPNDIVRWQLSSVAQCKWSLLSWRAQNILKLISISSKRTWQLFALPLMCEDQLVGMFLKTIERNQFCVLVKSSMIDIYAPSIGGELEYTYYILSFCSLGGRLVACITLIFFFLVISDV